MDFDTIFKAALEKARAIKIYLEKMQEIHDQQGDTLEKAGMFDAIDQLKEHILELTDAPDIIADLKQELKEQIDSNNKIADLITRSHNTSQTTTVRLF